MTANSAEDGGGAGNGSKLPAIPFNPRGDQQLAVGGSRGLKMGSPGNQHGGAPPSSARQNLQNPSRGKDTSTDAETQTSGWEVREEYRLAKLQRTTAEEQVAMYENRIQLLQQRKAKALQALEKTARRQEHRSRLRQKAEEEAVERHKHREENRERFEKALFQHRAMVEDTRARAQIRRLQTLEKNRETVRGVRAQKHMWRELRGAMMEQEANLTRQKKESVQASERMAHQNKESAVVGRIEENRDRMRREIAESHKSFQKNTRLIGQYAEIERNLIDFVKMAEAEHELNEAELHEYICTAPSTRVDRIACALAGRRTTSSGFFTDRSSDRNGSGAGGGPVLDFGYATLGGGYEGFSHASQLSAMRTA